MSSSPKQLLSVPDGILLTIGMVIGVGIFKAPSIVAANSASVGGFLLIWIVGGIVSLCGALVYAELAARHPHSGGEYTFLQKAFGIDTAFLFAWGRMTVIQTGAIAAVAFVFGEYASQLYSFGNMSSAIWAAIGVVALTALNFAGTLQSKVLQKVMEISLISAMVLISFAAIMKGGAPAVSGETGGKGGALGLAMLFVLFTYGGWNEAAYLAGEVKDARRNMTRVLVWGIVGVTALYLLVNIGYLAVLGLDGIKNSKAVGADVVRALAGEQGAVLIAIVVCVSALTTMNAAIFTGARTNWALGQDFPLFRMLGNWREKGSTPGNALIIQGVISLVLIGVGAQTQDGFSAMVAYTAPVFWTFFLLTGIALFTFQARGGEEPTFRVPFHPLITLAFCGMCIYMLLSSISYIQNPDFGPKFGNAVLGGLIVLAAGIPMYWIARRSK
jgi:APA family basic amino acid/polyamine antiporter